MRLIQRSSTRAMPQGMMLIRGVTAGHQHILQATKNILLGRQNMGTLPVLVKPRAQPMTTGMLGSIQGHQKQHQGMQDPRRRILTIQEGTALLSMTQQPTAMQPLLPIHTTRSMNIVRHDRHPTAPLTITPMRMSQQPMPTGPRRPAHIMQSMSTMRQDRLPTGPLPGGRKLPQALLLQQVSTSHMPMPLRFETG